MKPLCYDGYCGLGGWAEGFLAEGWRIVGFDNVEQPTYPGEFQLRDTRTIHGSELADADCLVFSPPCQGYSYRAMPWKRAKALPPPSNELFDACFRIQEEACEAAGRHIPMVVENVKGAQPWVGRARWHYGSYYLWGDVPALMPFSRSSAVKGNQPRRDGDRPNGTGRTSWFFQQRSDPRDSEAIKQGGNWWHDPKSLTRRFSSRSAARKHASAMIAKIPFALARHIACVYKGAYIPI